MTGHQIVGILLLGLGLLLIGLRVGFVICDNRGHRRRYTGTPHPFGDSQRRVDQATRYVRRPDDRGGGE